MFDITLFTKPLDAKLHKRYIEQLSFSMLKHILPEFASKFIWLDSPDLQTEDKTIGIEITEAIAPETAQIDGEHAKWRFGKQTEHDKQECKRLIEKNGGLYQNIKNFTCGRKF